MTSLGENHRPGHSDLGLVPPTVLYIEPAEVRSIHPG